jgi:hypothetical protein
MFQNEHGAIANTLTLENFPSKGSLEENSLTVKQEEVAMLFIFFSSGQVKITVGCNLYSTVRYKAFDRLNFGHRNGHEEPPPSSYSLLERFPRHSQLIITFIERRCTNQ